MRLASVECKAEQQSLPSPVSIYVSLQQVATKYFLSCTAALVAESVTYPLDITKTRLQIARNAASIGGTRAPTGMLRVTLDIARNEGMLALWSGVAPAIYRHYLYTGIRMGCYEWMRSLVYEKSKEAHFPVWKSMLSGLVSGAVAQFVASPTDLVKVQMQMEGLRRTQGLEPRFRSTWHAFADLKQTHGWRGLWMGWVPNCQRAALLNMADIATYDYVKHWLLSKAEMPDNMTTHATASACAGFAAAVVSTPADVVKTRMMDQIRQQHDAAKNGLKPPKLYRGSLHCLRSVYKHEGFFALYRGFIPIYIRMAPWSLTFWVSYEKIRWFVGAPSF